jgi:hypothetical protein
MIPTISELLQPLDERERLAVDRAAARLFSNDDFQLVFRKLNMDCGGVLGAVFLPSNNGDTVKAGAVDGSKGPVRWLLDRFIHQHEEKQEPKEQET